MDEAIERLKAYFYARDDISFALLFGSRAKGLSHAESDWDIAVYFRPASGGLDLENPDRAFPAEDEIWADAESIVGGSVDLVVLNRAPATICASALYEGMPLSCPDNKAYDRFFLAATALAEDERDFARDFLAIKARSASLSEIDRDRLIRIVDFIQGELADAASFDGISASAYATDSTLRRNLERWVENLVNDSIDVAKILVASQKQSLPQTYRETLLRLAALPGFEPSDCEVLASFPRLRNLLAHEYLDIRYPHIEAFARAAPEILARLVSSTRRTLQERPLSGASLE